MVHIDSYEFGRVTIDGKTYTRDVMVFSDRVAGWWRKEGHRVDVEDLEEILKWKPEKLIIGTGFSGCMEVPEETLRELRREGIEVLVCETKEAVEVFNRTKGRVAAALHLTC